MATYKLIIDDEVDPLTNYLNHPQWPIEKEYEPDWIREMGL
jgi:hypothetical protein